MKTFRALIGIGVVGAALSASAQSVYVDLDIGIGDAGIGNGAPSDSFGGAAGVPGKWDRIPADAGGPNR